MEEHEREREKEKKESRKQGDVVFSAGLKQLQKQLSSLEAMLKLVKTDVLSLKQDVG